MILYYLSIHSKPIHICNIVLTASLIYRHVLQKEYYNGMHQSNRKNNQCLLQKLFWILFPKSRYFKFSQMKYSNLMSYNKQCLYINSVLFYYYKWQRNPFITSIQIKDSIAFSRHATSWLMGESRNATYVQRTNHVHLYGYWTIFFVFFGFKGFFLWPVQIQN
jgi:hypothetical protein